MAGFLLDRPRTLPPPATGKSAHLLVTKFTGVKRHLLGLRHCSEIEDLSLAVSRR